jgi:hypothetical protein
VGQHTVEQTASGRPQRSLRTAPGQHAQPCRGAPSGWCRWMSMAASTAAAA